MKKLKCITNIIVTTLFVGFIFSGISRFGMPVRVRSGNESIFEGIYVDIPENQEAYISYFPRFTGVLKSFDYQDDINNSNVTVHIYEKEKNDWESSLTRELQRTGQVERIELPIDDSIFKSDRMARVIGTSVGSSSYDLYIKYRDRYFIGTVTDTRVKNPSNALDVLGNGILRTEKN